jgi:hypothetical protein
MMILPNGYWTISALQLAIYPGVLDLSARKSAPQRGFDVETASLRTEPLQKI